MVFCILFLFTCHTASRLFRNSVVGTYEIEMLAAANTFQSPASFFLKIQAFKVQSCSTCTTQPENTKNRDLISHFAYFLTIFCKTVLQKCIKKLLNAPLNVCLTFQGAARTPYFCKLRDATYGKRTFASHF